MYGFLSFPDVYVVKIDALVVNFGLCSKTHTFVAEVEPKTLNLLKEEIV